MDPKANQPTLQINKIYSFLMTQEDNLHDLRNTEETVLLNQQKYLLGIYATKFYCINNTFCKINKIFVI